MYVCTYICTYVCNVCMYVSMYVCMYVRTYVCTYVCMYVRMYVRMYVCMCIYIYIYIYYTYSMCMSICFVTVSNTRHCKRISQPTSLAAPLLTFERICRAHQQTWSTTLVVASLPLSTRPYDVPRRYTIPKAAEK